MTIKCPHTRAPCEEEQCHLDEICMINKKPATEEWVEPLQTQGDYAMTRKVIPGVLYPEEEEDAA